MHSLYRDSVRQPSVKTRAPASTSGALRARDFASSDALPVPRDLEQLYWVTCVHPNAVRLFEREWLVKPIL